MPGKGVAWILGFVGSDRGINKLRNFVHAEAFVSTAKTKDLPYGFFFGGGGHS